MNEQVQTESTTQNRIFETTIDAMPLYTKINNLKIAEIVTMINSLETDTVLLVIDHVVWGTYSKDLPLEEIKDKRVFLWKAPDGEKVKNFSDLQNCLEFFLDKGVHRRAHLVCIGGGSTSDFAGMVAATLLRGIPWSVIPTTLLGMIDASIGGKVAINSKAGKNLIGAFHRPNHVWLAEEFLLSLPKSELYSGYGEILKYAFLNYDVYRLIIQLKDKKNPSKLSEIIHVAAKYKSEITDNDFRENGMRKILNLGHTFGHAIEFIYSIPHGDAVLWGIFLMIKIYGNDKNFNDLIALKESLDLPVNNPPWFNKEFQVDRIMTYLMKDKKISSTGLVDLVMIKDIGNVEVESHSFDEIRKQLEDNKEILKKSTLSKEICQ